MQTCLVAGGAGFIGANLCESLLKDGFRVICFDNFITSNKKNIDKFKVDKNFVFIEQDITKEFEVNEKIDYIFHLASPASPNHHSKLSYHSLPFETMLANTTGTINLLNLAGKNNSKFLFASTSEAYGDPLEHPQKEEYRGNVSTIGPRSVYDESKRFGETITSYYQRNKDIDTRIVRIFNTYGPGMLIEDKRMVIDFIMQSIQGKPITVFGDGTQTRSLCFVGDLVEGLKKLMFSSNTKGEIVNLGSDEEHTVMDYANIIKKIANSNSEIVLSEVLPTDDPLKRRPDITKAKKLLEWEPKVSLEDGLTKTIEYFKGL